MKTLIEFNNFCVLLNYLIKFGFCLLKDQVGYFYDLILICVLKHVSIVNVTKICF